MSKSELLNGLTNAKLHKVKARMIREALRNGACERGNHAVTADDAYVCFYYRGVELAEVHIDTLKVINMDVSEFEHTASTSYHRKTISEAVAEIKAVLLIKGDYSYASAEARAEL